MRLIHVGDGPLNAPGTLTFEELLGINVPPYAILSHTWDAGEVSYKDFVKGRGLLMEGYTKIIGCAREAKANGIDYIWVDTCCIDKRSSAELTEAINSMYRWYQDSEVCYVYMKDVTRGFGDDYLGDFKKSRWFRRGWTLQELIAPLEVVFFDTNWKRLSARFHIEDELRRITGIPQTVFRGKHLGTFSVYERMKWASQRETTRTEDMAYCLMGIFDINMPLLYGEGDKAFLRLQEQIIRQNTRDYSVFVWSALSNAQDDPKPSSSQLGSSQLSSTAPPSSQGSNETVTLDRALPMSCGPLALSPLCFSMKGRTRPGRTAAPIKLTGSDIQLTVRLIPLTGQHHLFRAILPLALETRSPKYTPSLAIYVMKISSSGQDQEDSPKFVRVKPSIVEHAKRYYEDTEEDVKPSEITLCTVKRTLWIRALPKSTLSIYAQGPQPFKLLGTTAYARRSAGCEVHVEEVVGKAAGFAYQSPAGTRIVVIGLNSYGAPWAHILICEIDAEDSEYESFNPETYDSFEDNDQNGGLGVIVWYVYFNGALRLTARVAEITQDGPEGAVDQRPDSASVISSTEGRIRHV